MEAQVSVDLAAFEAELGVNLPTADLATLAPAVREKVQDFAADVARDFADGVAESLGVSSEDVQISCVYRLDDVDKLNILTFADSCVDSRLRRLAAKRRLQDSGLGMVVEMKEAAKDQVVESDGGSMASVMEAIEQAPVEVAYGGTTVQAAVVEGSMVDSVAVVQRTASPTPAPTDPTPDPTTDPAPAEPGTLTGETA